MPLLAATNISHAFGTRVILSGATLSIEEGERVGIVGRNGQGKSTFMRVMAGAMKPDSGTIEQARHCRVGYLHQDPQFEAGDTLRDAAERAFEELHSLHEQLNAVYDAMAGPEGADPDGLEKLMNQQARLEERIEAAGGYAVDHKIDAVLHGLGFTDGQFTVPVESLSGGQKARLSLAKLLLEGPDVLLLDEPTNHLDIDGRLWLEAFLREEFRGAVVMISHDRYLLDHVVTRIIEVEQGRLIDYPAPKGNAYLNFRKLRVERKEVQMRSWETQQTKFRQEEAFIRKYKAGQRAKQAKGRESKLDREKRDSTLEKPLELGTFKFDLPKADRSGEIVARARGLSMGYPLEDGTRKDLFRKLDLTITRGDRWAIIGPNGAGKSTLVKCLLGELEQTDGEVTLGANLKVGYFSQSSAGMDPQMQVFRYLQKVIKDENPEKPLTEQQARDLAGAFLFSGEEQDAEIQRLSGGEKGRVRLAALLASAKNVLVLDEPTNHLDIESAERLEAALALPVEATSEQPGRAGGPFDGTSILISHDRAMIDGCANKLIILDGEGNAEIFEGNYSEYFRKQQERAQAAKQREEQAKAQREAQAKRERAAEEERAAKKASEKSSKQGGKARGAGASSTYDKMSQSKLESEIERIENRIKAIDKEMADPDVWRNHSKMTALGDERSKLHGQLEPLEFEWGRRAEEV